MQNLLAETVTLRTCYDTSKLPFSFPDSNCDSICYAINQCKLACQVVVSKYSFHFARRVTCNVVWRWFIHKIERSNSRSTVPFRLKKKKKIFDRRVPTFPLKFEFNPLDRDWNLNFEQREHFPPPVHQ